MSFVNYATTPAQTRIAELLDQGLSAGEISRKLGKNDSYIRRKVRAIKAEAHNSGYNPDYGMLEEYPQGNHFTKATVHRNAAGNILQVWDRFSKDEAERLHTFRKAADAISEAHTPYPVVPETPGLDYDTDRIPWYQIGDGHIGMLAFESVVGQSFDLDTGKRELEYAVLKLIGETPPCERCVIQDHGDLTHYDNISGVTARSGHQLDCAGTFGQMLDAAMELMQSFIGAALQRHKYVDVIINQGNHSGVNDLWMARHLRYMYANNPRVTILNNDRVVIPYRMGNTFVACHHGHEIKPQNMPAVMHNDYRQDCGEALYRYADLAHVHHNWSAKDISGVKVESFNNLAPLDKHASEKGYRSRSFIVRLMRSRTYGEQGSQRVTLEEVRDAIHGRPAGDSANERPDVHTV